jgi:hypothetical protein
MHERMASWGLGFELDPRRAIIRAGCMGMGFPITTLGLLWMQYCSGRRSFIYYLIFIYSNNFWKENGNFVFLCVSHCVSMLVVYRCTFGPGLMGRPEARKKKHGPGTARPEII